MSDTIQSIHNGVLEGDLNVNGHGFIGDTSNLGLQVQSAGLTSIASLTQGAGFPAALRTYIGAGVSSFSGAYSSLSGIPSTFPPTAHATNHATGGTDSLIPSAIGAATSAQGTKADSAIQSIATPGVIFTNPVSVTAGAATLALVNQAANTFFGNGTGSSAQPTFMSASTARIALALGSLATQSGTFSGTSSGTNTGDNAVNSLYSGLVSNATHTGDVTGSTALTIVTAQPAVHTWALTQTFTVAPVFTDQSGSRTALGLGSLATQSGTFSGTSSGTNTGDQDLSSYQVKTGTLALGGFGAITGTVPIANIPTGASSSTVALGNHTHTGVYQPAVAALDTWALTTPPSSYAIGDLLYASAANTLSKLVDIATGNVLISGGVTTAPSWGKVTTAHVTGIAPLASPTFTGTPVAPTAAVNTNTTQLATTAFVLAQAGNKQLIVADGTVGTYTFTIPSGYTSIRILVNGRSSAAVDGIGLRVQFNSDTGANYDTESVYWEGSTTGAAGATISGTYAVIGWIPGANATASYSGSVNTSIPGYANTAFFKTYISQTAGRDGGLLYMDRSGGNWKNTAAITSATIFLGSGNFVSGSTIEVITE